MSTFTLRIRWRHSCALALTLGAADAQTNWFPLQQPIPGRMFHSTVYDDARERVVLFGGYLRQTSSGVLGDTWEWDGAGWTERPTTNGPSARLRHAMAFDQARGVVVLFGGKPRFLGPGMSDTWEWDGNQWTQRFPATVPPPRFDHAMTYDPVRQSVWLIGGGIPGVASTGPDIWEWDGTDWVDRTPTVKPRAWGGQAAVYDSVRQRTVTYGGQVMRGAISEMWEWDGTSWTQLNPAVDPGPRDGHSMVYDRARQRIVLFLGTDTWEWDGSSWTQVTPATSPTTRREHAMAYDAARGRALLFGGETLPFGGVQDDTWQWDGTNWTQPVLEPSHPPGRSSHAMAFDTNAQRVLVFAGTNCLSSRLNDLWEWDGTGWIQRTEQPRPPGRWLTAMAFDAARNRTVVFGGCGSGVPGSRLGDTWEWDGSQWLRHSPGVAPPGRCNPAMTYDRARQRVVLFGGSGLSGDLNDTWEWDGTTWSELQPAVRPPARSFHAIAYDVARRRTVLFGGGTVASPLGDTWEWDGSDWVQRTPAVSPPPVSGPELAYDQDRGVVVLFAGSVSGLASSWDWDGTTWTKHSSISPRVTATAMTYDATRRQIVLFGGSAQNPASCLASLATWALDEGIAARAVALGAGCAGTNGTPSLGAFGRPSIGNARFALDLTSARTNTAAALWLGTNPVSVVLSGGCTVLVNPTGLVSVGSATNAYGFGSINVPIPDVSQFVGAFVFGQWAVLDPVAAPGVALTNGIEVLVGN